MCTIFKAPGPQYELRPVVGYENHCQSKYRNPRYSFGLRTPLICKAVSPGPKYDLGKNTRVGKHNPPAYSLILRHPPLTQFLTPSPLTYRVEDVPRMKEARPPKYSIRPRQPPLTPFCTPGPNQYDLPTTIGPKIPDINAKPAYSMRAKPPLIERERSPGPAKYPAGNLNVYKYKNPGYTCRSKLRDLCKLIGPGPAAYMIRGEFKGGYSLHPRTCGQPFITAEDNMPCINK